MLPLNAIDFTQVDIGCSQILVLGTQLGQLNIEAFLEMLYSRVVLHLGKIDHAYVGVSLRDI